MTDFVFDLPLAVSGAAVILILCIYGVGGLLLTRRWIISRLRMSADDSDFCGSMVQSIMVFYGLAVALIAVSVWETYSEVSKLVSSEATSLAALYRDVSAYPDPIRQGLQKELRDYTDYVIHEAWPKQQRGEVPVGGVEQVNRFQKVLAGFEPATEGQKLLHGEALRAYNLMVVARRLRLDAVKTGLPGVMWGVVVIGGFIGLSSAFFFKVEDARLHSILVALLAIFMGLVIFMVLALDRPFRGELGLPADPYQLVYDQLMKPAP